MGLVRQMLKPLYRYFREPEYRDFLRVQNACRNNPEGRVVLRMNGFTVEGNDGSSFLHQYEEIIQRKSFDFKPANDSPLIYCCGANIGLEVLRFAHQFPKARIKAYEADPALFALLKKNIESNRINAEVFNVALHTANGSISFSPDGKLGGKTGSGPVEVNAVRLKDLLAAETHVDLLVMDIEGAENAVIPDCADELHKIGQLFVEWHSDEKKSQDLPGLLALLEKSGFRYRLNNNLGTAPFEQVQIENGFDAMVDIYATRTRS